MTTHVIILMLPPSQVTRLISATGILCGLTQRFVLPKVGQYLTGLRLTCPVTVHGRGHGVSYIRMGYNDIWSVSLTLDGVPLHTLYKPHNIECTQEPVPCTYTAPVDFFQGWPIITEALYRGALGLEIEYLREPSTPIVLDGEMHFTDRQYHAALRSSCVNVPLTPSGINAASVGTYLDGILWLR